MVIKGEPPSMVKKESWSNLYNEVAGIRDSLRHQGSPSGSEVKNLPTVQELQETWIQSLGWEDPMEEDMATHSSILAWRIPWTEEPGGLQSMGSHRVGHDWNDLACTHAPGIKGDLHPVTENSIQGIRLGSKNGQDQDLRSKAIPVRNSPCWTKLRILRIVVPPSDSAFAI